VISLVGLELLWHRWRSVCISVIKKASLSADERLVKLYPAVLELAFPSVPWRAFRECCVIECGVVTGVRPAVLGWRWTNGRRDSQAFPLPSFSARLKFASTPAATAPPGLLDETGHQGDSFRSMCTWRPWSRCAPGLTSSAVLPFIISPLTIVHDSFVGFSAVCLTCRDHLGLMSPGSTSLIAPARPPALTFFTSGKELRVTSRNP